MKSFRVKLVGISPLLQHRMRTEELHALLGAKSKRKKDKVEQSPREIAESYAYRINDKFVVPTAYICGAFAAASGDYKQSSSSRKSYKSIAGGIFRPVEEFVELKDDKNKAIKDFEVDIRKATNHLKGAVAVCRPRFDKWQTEFNVTLDTDLISQETAHQILSDAGRRVGIGSFRVAKGGYFGQFQVTEWTEVK